MTTPSAEKEKALVNVSAIDRTWHKSLILLYNLLMHLPHPTLSYQIMFYFLLMFLHHLRFSFWLFRGLSMNLPLSEFKSSMPLFWSHPSSPVYWTYLHCLGLLTYCIRRWCLVQLFLLPLFQSHSNIKFFLGSFSLPWLIGDLFLMSHPNTRLRKAPPQSFDDVNPPRYTLHPFLYLFLCLLVFLFPCTWLRRLRLLLIFLLPLFQRLAVLFFFHLLQVSHLLPLWRLSCSTPWRKSWPCLRS